MKKDTPLLTLSVIIATFNSERTLERCLKSVISQQYPKEKLELIVSDGGSKDRTLAIAKKYHAKIIHVDSNKQNAEYNKGVGLSKANNEIVLLLDHDNILPHNNWMKNIIEPFMDSKAIVGVEPLRFHYDKSMTLLDRYFALFGGVDPVAYYLGKNSHLSYAYDTYNLTGKAVDKGNYYLVTFSPDKIPALGGNGAAFRREVLQKKAQALPDYFFHIDVHVDLIKKGYNTYALTKDTITHLTNNKIIPFLKRRVYFIEKYHFEDRSKRRYSVYEPKKDRWNLIKYVIISVTFIVPIIDAVRGFIKVRDIAWFIHPFMCFSMLVVYGIPTIKQEVGRVLKAT